MGVKIGETHQGSTKQSNYRLLALDQDIMHLFGTKLCGARRPPHMLILHGRHVAMQVEVVEMLRC